MTCAQQVDPERGHFIDAAASRAMERTNVDPPAILSALEEADSRTLDDSLLLFHLCTRDADYRRIPKGVEMLEFTSIEAATAFIRAPDSPIFREFCLSDSETTRYINIIDQVVQIAQKYGVNDKQHNLLAVGALIGGSIVTFLGIASLNIIAIGGGIAAVKKGLALSEQSETHNARLAQTINLAINSDLQLRSKLEKIVDLHNAVGALVKRLEITDPPRAGYKYSVDFPSIKYIQNIYRTHDGNLSVHIYVNHGAYSAKSHPKSIIFSIRESGIIMDYPMG